MTSKPLVLFDRNVPGCEVMASAQDDKAGWLKAREGVWTGTSLYLIAGFDPYGSAKAQTNRAIKEKLAPSDDKIGKLAIVRAGFFQEAGIGAWYAADSLVPVVDSGNVLVRRTADTVPVAATLDWVRDEMGTIEPVEIKNIGWSSSHNWHRWTAHSGGVDPWKYTLGPYPEPADINIESTPLNRKIAAKDVGTARGDLRQWSIDVYKLWEEAGPLCAPLKHWVQLQLQLHVLGATQGVITSAHGGNSRIDMLYPRHDAFLEYVLDRAAKAWEELEYKRDLKGGHI